VGAQEARVSDVDEALGESRLEESSDARFGGKRQGVPLSSSAVLVVEGYVSVFEHFNAAVGHGDPPDVRGEVLEDFCPGSGRFTVDDISFSTPVVARGQSAQRWSVCL
jgi:hypothetical protein